MVKSRGSFLFRTRIFFGNSGNFARGPEFFPRMNKTLFTLPFAAAALFTSSTAVFAEDEKPAPPNRRKAGGAPGDRLKAMSEKLSLTDEQKDKLKAIFEKNQPKMKELRADTALSQEDKRSKMAEIRKAEMEEIRALLTPEQQEKMKEMRTAAKGPKAGK